MITPSIGANISVAEAIKAGKRKAYWPALAIFLGALLLFFPMLGYAPFHPALLFCLAFGVGLVASWAWWAYHIVKKVSLPHALKITNQWIQFERQTPIWWEKVNMAITTCIRGKHPKYFIELHTGEEIIKWEVTDLNIRQKKLDHYLDVFRTRGRQMAK